MVNVATVNYLQIETGENAVWPAEIVQQENGWWPTGGAVDPENDGGLQNWQSLQLGQRTEWLKERMQGLGGEASFVPDADLSALDATGSFLVLDTAPDNPAAGFYGSVIHVEGADGRAWQNVVSSNGKSYTRVRTDAAPTWTAWREGAARSDFVGTVAEAGGAPTGAIIERGNNANGDYTKFADGTMFAWRVEHTFSDNSTLQQKPMPATFMAPPAVAFSRKYGGATTGENHITRFEVSADSSNWFVSVDVSVTGWLVGSLFAVGRWF